MSASLEIELDGQVDIPALSREAGVTTASRQNGQLTVGVDSLSASALVCY